MWTSRRQGLQGEEKEDEGASSQGWALILLQRSCGGGGRRGRVVSCLGGAVSGPPEGPLGDKAGGSSS